MRRKKKKQQDKKRKQKKVEAIKLEFADENVTSFGGLALAERLALRLGLWTKLDKLVPRRSGQYSWLEIIKAAVSGLLSGSPGTVECAEVRCDEALLGLLGIDQAPDDVTFWRSLEQLGRREVKGVLDRVQRLWSRLILESADRSELLFHGFFPLFGDGSLLEGSHRREATTCIEGKGVGLLWSTWFAGPMLVAQMLADKGEGEQSNLKEMLPGVIREVLEPLRLKDRALVLLDSLHGDGPTCDLLEKESLKYIVGANKLAKTQQILSQQPDCVWIETGANEKFGWSESAICVCTIQCDQWETRRVLIGRRWKRQGEFLYNYSGVMTNLRQADVAHLRSDQRCFAAAIWMLYDGKSGSENYYKDILEDLDGHHPPCEKLAHNSGYYALLSLAYALGRGVDLIGGKSPERGRRRRRDGKLRKRAKPRSMRLWRLRRRFFCLAGRVASHARRASVTLLGVSEEIRAEFQARFIRLCRC